MWQVYENALVYLDSVWRWPCHRPLYERRRNCLGYEWKCIFPRWLRCPMVAARTLWEVRLSDCRCSREREKNTKINALSIESKSKDHWPESLRMPPIEIHQHRRYPHVKCLDLSSSWRTGPSRPLDVCLEKRWNGMRRKNGSSQQSRRKSNGNFEKSPIEY